MFGIYNKIIFLKTNLLKKESFVCLIGIVLSWTILGSVPSFQLGGVYPQVETQIIFLHLIAALLFFYKSVKLFLNPSEMLFN